MCTPLAKDRGCTVTPAKVRHIPSSEAMHEVNTAHGRHEVSDARALTIASWWQSPGSVGHVMAALASGLPVEVEALLDDIAATHNSFTSWRPSDLRALDMLATWAINHPSRPRVQS